MTQIKSELLLASLNKQTGDILYTFKWVYPRFILSEVNTHRVLSRNTSSSRAIPNKKQRQRVLDDPFIPISIGQAKKGMQAGEELVGVKRWVAEKVWSGARYPAVGAAWLLDKLGAHKQLSNRVIEPWTWTTQLVTATDLDNLFKLRCHEAAEPHFQELARQAKDQVNKISTILKHDLKVGGWKSRAGLIVVHDNGDETRIQILFTGDGVINWHLPYLLPNEEFLGLDVARKLSAARCARVSYNMPDSNKQSSYDEDMILAGRLVTEGHMSPFEHQATPLETSERSGNFKGWSQYRKELEKEERKELAKRRGVMYYE